MRPPWQPSWTVSPVGWLVGPLLLLSLPPNVTPVSAEGPDVFETTVRPLLTETCLSCHASETRKGGLDLTRRAAALDGGDSGEAIIPGKPEESLLFEKIAAGEMPPKKPLAPDQVAAFRVWIEAGAPYHGEPLSPRRAGPDWWSLQPIQRPAIPRVQHPGWVRTPIDAFVLSRLEADHLEPAPEADPISLLRRLTFDLTGLPPTPEESDEFHAGFRRDPEAAVEAVVDRLLASPAYGERWARHWLDVVRFAESHGYETNQLRPNAWPYRDYVIRAFNTDIGFDRFVLEQLAADTLPEADWLTRAATGFLVGGTHDVVGNQTVEGKLQQRADDLDDIVTATATTFLGLTVNCARCHDHKFDPISQKDYYGLAAVFAGLEHGEREIPAPDIDRRRAEAGLISTELVLLDRRFDEFEPLARTNVTEPARAMVHSRRNVERFAPTPARFVRFTIAATNSGTEPCIDELEIWTATAQPRNVAPHATTSASSTYPNSNIHRLEHINDGRYGNSHSWISAEAGAGWVLLDLGRVERIDRLVWGRDREEKYKDRTPIAYRIEIASEPDHWQVVASSTDRLPWKAEAAADTEPPGLTPEDRARRQALIDRQRGLRERLARLGPTIPIYAGVFKEAAPTYRLRRGDPTQKLEEVPPSGVRSVRPALELRPDLPESDRRVALAHWLADPANPLSWRVMVNRVWKDHFGTGLVSTPSDFGFNGDRPSHPELLDWLASEFVAGGGHLKPIHRLIVLSSTYRQSTRFNERAAAHDRANRLLWRLAPRRLEAEEIRDSVLAVSGSLDHRMGGPGYWIWEPNTNYVVVFKPLNNLGPEHFRRMIYMYKPRSQQDPTFGGFDCPDGGLVAPRRNSSTTALQALNLLNSPFLLDQADRFADRLNHESDSSESAVRRAFRLAFQRDPSPDEMREALELVQEHGLPTLCRALYNANEFLYVP